MPWCAGSGEDARQHAAVVVVVVVVVVGGGGGGGGSGSGGSPGGGNSAGGRGALCRHISDQGSFDHLEQIPWGTSSRWPVAQERAML